MLKSEFHGPAGPELLYSRYGAPLYSYILQFVRDKAEAGTLLVDIFSRLTPQLADAFDSNLSVYCWLQVEARKIILEHIQGKSGDAGRPAGAGSGRGAGGAAGQTGAGTAQGVRTSARQTTGLPAEGPSSEELASGVIFARSPGTPMSYFSLLEDAPPEHQWVFRELFLYGRTKEELALHSGKDLAPVSRILRECLRMIRKSLG